MMDETMGIANTVKCAEETDFVEVMFARNTQEAKDCIQFLLENQVPSRLESERGKQAEYGVAVLVPSDRMIEATELLAARAQLEDEDEEGEDEELDDDLDDDLDDEDDDFEDDDDDDLEDDDDDLDDDEEVEEDDDF